MLLSHHHYLVIGLSLVSSGLFSVAEAEKNQALARLLRFLGGGLKYKLAVTFAI